MAAAALLSRSVGRTRACVQLLLTPEGSSHIRISEREKTLFIIPSQEGEERGGRLLALASFPMPLTRFCLMAHGKKEGRRKKGEEEEADS